MWRDAGQQLRSIARWCALSLVLNLIWEIVQLPLYTIPSESQVAYAVIHCTIGDAVIAAITFVISALLLRNADWPITDPWRGASVVMLLGVAYTGYSEWHSVYQAGYWGYTSSMPLVFGVGLAPLLQWIFVPTASILILGIRHIRSQSGSH